MGRRSRYQWKWALSHADGTNAGRMGRRLHGLVHYEVADGEGTLNSVLLLLGLLIGRLVPIVRTHHQNMVQVQVAEH